MPYKNYIYPATGILFFSVFFFGEMTPCFASKSSFSIEEGSGNFSLIRNQVKLFTYVWEDPEILRPYFCNVRIYDGTPITRPYPTDPEINKGNDDHATFHPGIWMAFGDVNGLDFWRNKARMRVTQLPKPELRFLGVEYMLQFEDAFILESLDLNATPIARGRNRFTVSFHDNAYIISWCMIMEPEGDKPLVFGDQEEMGLGARINTPLTVEFGTGKIVNSEGQQNESGTWGKEAKWCTYSAKVDSGHVGVTLFSEKPCWWHTRDYGLMVANAYGKKSMIGSSDSAVAPMQTIIAPGKQLRRAYGICVFDVNEGAHNPETVLKNLQNSLFICDSD